jgi:Ni2+-binding GTPase involved in maturation of urease and hydrogenase
MWWPSTKWISPAFVGVDPERIASDYRKVNPHGKVVFTDARSGRGVEELLSALGF